MRWKFLIALPIFISIALLWHYGFFERPELMLYDMRVKIIRSSKKPPDEISVILIDEASLKLMNSISGRWPWPRSVHADVIDFLRLGGARAIVFDILFTENERIYEAPPGMLSANDSALVESTKGAGNVYHAAQIFKDIPDEWNRDILDKKLPEDFQRMFGLTNVRLIHIKENNNYAIPFRELYRASKGIGIVEFKSDKDGVYRRTKLIRTYHGSHFPVLSIAPLIEPDYLIKEEKNSLLLQTASGIKKIPLYNGLYIINLYGGFEPYSMSGILASIHKIKRGNIEGLPVSPDEFNKKVVFIGASAVGVEDLKPTPLSAMIPGVLLHASIYGNILTEDFLRWSPGILTGLSIIIMAFFINYMVLTIRSFGLKIILSLLPLVLYILLSLIAFKLNFVMEMAAPLTSGILSFVTAFTYLSLTEEKEKRRIKEMFERYVSSAVIAGISEKKGSLLLAERGIRVELTVLFSDIEGFTSLSERYPAEDIVEALNIYFERAVEIIFRYEGTIDKFMGDCIMAFWGAPVRMEDHALRAVMSSLQIQREMAEVNRILKEKGLPELKTGTGIHTGEVILGNIGSPKRLDYTVIGDNVNLASRLQGLTRLYRVPIIISEDTAQRVKTRVLLRPIDVVRVKGKVKPVKIFEPLMEGDSNGKITLLSEQALEYYLSRRWQEALAMYKEMEELSLGDTVPRIFIERITYFMKKEPEPSWDGVWEVMEK
ncbi:MAG: CHASE2 domain-containing protein [Thermodesulfovibrionales bacterium]